MNGALMCTMGFFDKTYLLLTATGFTLNADGLDRMDAAFSLVPKIFKNAECKLEIVHCRLLILLSCPANAIDKAGINTWMPTPRELADMEKGYAFFRYFFTYDVTSTGARVFMRLGRVDDAYELARIAVSEEQQTQKK